MCNVAALVFVATVRVLCVVVCVVLARASVRQTVDKHNNSSADLKNDGSCVAAKH
jgi:hypothetical protein